VAAADLDSRRKEVTMSTSQAEPVSAAVARTTRTDSGTEKPATRTRHTRTNASEEDNGCARYFLAKANGDGSTPALDKEVATEGEALVEALRSGVTYYAVQEFRVIPDLAGKRPQLKKEAVRGK
jgi:hypothetical protein